MMSVARPEVREYSFLPAGVYDKDTFALRLMDKPASYFLRRTLEQAIPPHPAHRQ
ncbi:MAG: hypothetical protein ACLVJH_04510 [Faecalibacterium prausnitzii]